MNEQTDVLQGSFLVTQAVAQALVACGARKGSIITVGSIVGKVRFLSRAIIKYMSTTLLLTVSLHELMSAGRKHWAGELRCL